MRLGIKAYHCGTKRNICQIQQVAPQVSKDVEGLWLGITSSFRSNTLLILAFGRQERVPPITVETIPHRGERSCIIGPELLLSTAPT